MYISHVETKTFLFVNKRIDEPQLVFFFSLDILFTDSIYHQPSIVTSNVNKFYGLQKDKNGKSTITTYDIGGRKSHRIYSTNRELSKFWVSGLEDGGPISLSCDVVLLLVFSSSLDSFACASSNFAFDFVCISLYFSP